MTATIRDRLAAALATGSDADLAAWASTGPAAVLVLRDELGGKATTEPARPVHPRVIIDNLSAAAAAIASADPKRSSPHLPVLNGPRTRSSSSVSGESTTDVPPRGS